MLPKFAERAGVIPRVPADGLRHTHAAQPRSEGVDIAVNAGVPSNDMCGSSFNLNSVAMPYGVQIDTSAATSDTVYIFGGFPASFANGIWFTFTSPSPGYLICEDPVNYPFSNGGPGTIFTLVDACDGSLSAIVGHEADPRFSDVDPNSEEDPDISLVRSIYRINTTGEAVYILVSSTIEEVLVPGSPFYDLKFDFVTLGTPTNDTCATAFNISAATMPYSPIVDNELAGTEASDCGSIYRGVWYAFTAPERGYLTCTSTTEQPTLWATNDTNNCSTTPICIGDDSAPHYILLNAGETIQILVGSSNSTPDLIRPLGPKFEFTAVPANDTCAEATNLNTVGLPFVDTIDNWAATDDFTDCDSVFFGTWFTYTPSWTGYLGVTTNWGVNSTPQAWAVGAGCKTTPECITVERRDIFTTSHTPIPITAGQPIMLLLGYALPFVETPELIKLYSIVLLPDDCSNPLPLPVPGMIEGALAPATKTPGEFPFSCSSIEDPDVWYSLSILSGGQYTLRLTALLADHDWPLSLSLFDNCPDNNGAELACSLRHLSNPNPVEMSTLLNPGTYLVRVAGTPGALTDRFQLEVTLARCPADFNHVNGVTVQDIFDFLTAWLAGC